MNIYLEFNVRMDYILSEHITTPFSTSLICAQKVLGKNLLARCTGGTLRCEYRS